MIVFIHPVAKCNYINYHKQITYAESLFFAGRSKESLAKYREIFSAYKPFAKDCFIALQFSAMVQDTGSFKFFFSKGIENGLNWITIRKSGRVTRLINETKGLKQELEHVYQNKRTKYIQSINSSIRDSIFLLRRRDDTSRWLSKKNRVRSGYFYYIKDTILDENLHMLISIAKRLGYPGQRMIGVRDPEIDNEPESPNLLESIASVILYHHYCGYIQMEQELYDGLVNGEILPSNYALIYQWAYHGYYESKGAMRGGNNRYIFKTKCEYPPQEKFYNNFIIPWNYCKDTILVNNCRREIGMESIQHQLVKKQFAKRNDLLLSTGIFNLY